MELLTYDQAAHLVNVPTGTLYAWVSQRRVPHVRISARLVRFDREALEAWLKARRVSEQYTAALRSEAAYSKKRQTDGDL